MATFPGGYSEKTSIVAADKVLIADSEASNAVKYAQVSNLAQEYINRSYTVVSPQGSSGTYYTAGWYETAAADADLTQASLTQTIGTANGAYAAHAFIVASAAGTTDGSDLVLTVSGTSITDAGVRTGADSEVIVADCTASATDQYYETSKKWIGQVTFTLSSTGGATFAYTFNYGLCKYEDMGNVDFTLTLFEAVGRAGATDSGFNIEIIKHTSTGWTYHATAFVPGPAALYDLQTDYNTEYSLIIGDPFAWKRTGLSDAIAGSSSEGLVIRVTTSANAALEQCNIHVEATKG